VDRGAGEGGGREVRDRARGERDNVLSVLLKGLHQARISSALLVAVFIVAALHIPTVAGTLLLKLA
jgi:hypothetical protein